MVFKYDIADPTMANIFVCHIDLFDPVLRFVGILETYPDEHPNRVGVSWMETGIPD